jgi:uncharacterized protein (TIGR02001 family)
MKYLAIKVIGAACVAAAPLFSQAQLTSNIALTTNYKFRGQDQDMLGRDGLAKDNWFKPAVQGGLDYTFGESGFYVGNWNSSVNWLSGNSIEMDFYGGYKFNVDKLGLDVGTLTYYYPGNTRGNTTEIYGAASYAFENIGNFALKYSHTVSKDYFNYAGARAGSGLDGRNTGYLNLGYSLEVMPNVMLKASLGYTRMNSDIRSLGYQSFIDYGAGGAYDFGAGLVFQAMVQGANRAASYATPSESGVGQTYSPNRNRLILTLTKSM